MDRGFALDSAQSFIITKGFIDAKDDRGRTMYGTFLGVVSRRDISYLSVMFSREEASKSLNWNELLFLHEEKEKNSARDPLISHYEEELQRYLNTSMVLNNIAKNRNAKQAEQAVSRYCLDGLQFKAVCFIEIYDATESDLKAFVKVPKDKKKEAKPTPDQPGGDDGQSTDGGRKDHSPNDIFVKCDPILDPVNGVAMNDLKIGDQVLGRLPTNSVFYKVLAKNSPTFEGVVTAKVSGILVNDLGTATVSLDISDGVSGVMKLSGKVRVRLAEAAKPKPFAGARFSISNIPPELVFTAAGILLFIAGIILVYYIFY
ncbi:MAG: hypothetical protein LBQ56_01755 [Synergistaceae bacterium]|jgi:hypothetical protein|nr:hypothetical protein [Synergistaceae bacterium]